MRSNNQKVAISIAYLNKNTKSIQIKSLDEKMRIDDQNNEILNS